MKKYLFIVAGVIFCNVLVAQRVVLNSPKDLYTDPAITITMTEIGESSFTATLEPNTECTRYYYVAMSLEDISMWTMIGFPLEQMITMWGIEATTAETHTWTDMIPNTTYKIFALPYGAGDVTYPVCSIEFTTNAIGGGGLSVIDVVVNNITENSAQVVFTPNENTALYYDGLIEVSLYDQVGKDSACTLLRENMVEPKYSVDDWIWSSLAPNTAYYAIAFGQNAVGEWGDTTVYAFTTLDASSVNDYNFSEVSVFPMPCQGSFTIAGDQICNGKAIVYSSNGQYIQEINISSTQQNIETSLPTGNYLIQIFNATGNFVTVKKIIIR